MRERLPWGRSHRVTKAAIAVLSGVVAGVLAAPAAVAGGVGEWTQVSDFPAGAAYPRGKSIDEPTIGRLGSALQVVWPGQQSPQTSSYATAVIGPDGSVVAPARTILSGWATLSRNPRLISVGGLQFLAFSGVQSTDTTAPYTTGAEYAATSPDGLGWALSPGSMSASTSAYSGYGNDAVDNAGVPVWVGNPGSVTGINWHQGVAATDPAPAGSDGTFRLAGCCAYESAVARDQANGAVYAAFYSNSGTPGENGIWTGQILPAQGTFARAAGSAVGSGSSEESIDPGQRVALAARTGGGVYVAYKLGYPRVSGIRILNVATGAALDVPGSARASRIALAADAGGRLWIAWVSGGTVKVAHTNPALTVVGAAGRLGAPPGSEEIWKVAADGNPSAGRVDVVVTSGTSAGRVNVWHAQALRTLTVQPPASTTPGGTALITVTDAGDPVAGARVRLGSDSAITDAAGQARLDVPRRPRGALVTATKAGYGKGSARLR